MDDHTTNETQDGTRAGSPAPSTGITRGPRGNILPNRSEKGVDPSVTLTEAGVPYEQSLRHHRYTFTRTPSGVTLEGCGRETPNEKLETQRYSADTQWSVNKTEFAADGSKVLCAAAWSEVDPENLFSLLRGDEIVPFNIQFDADFEEVTKTPKQSSKKTSNNPSARPPTEDKRPKSFAELFASPDF
jgi:hypothetical protein